MAILTPLAVIGLMYAVPVILGWLIGAFVQVLFGTRTLVAFWAVLGSWAGYGLWRIIGWSPSPGHETKDAYYAFLIYESVIPAFLIGLAFPLARPMVARFRDPSGPYCSWKPPREQVNAHPPGITEVRTEDDGPGSARR